MPTVTTTLAGFGRWIEEVQPNPNFENCGAEVVERTDSNYWQAVEAICGRISQMLEANCADTQNIRNAAAATAAKAQWSDFIKYYDKAYCDALAARDSRLKNR